MVLPFFAETLTPALAFLSCTEKLAKIAGAAGGTAKSEPSLDLKVAGATHWASRWMNSYGVAAKLLSFEESLAVGVWESDGVVLITTA